LLLGAVAPAIHKVGIPGTQQKGFTMLYAGIDVSKDSLDLFLDGQVSRLSNDSRGFAALKRRLRSGCTAVLESTGGYERGCAEALRAAGVAVAVVNPFRVAHYRKALGFHAKTDVIDAELLARFGQDRALVDTGAEQHPELNDVTDRRHQLVGILAAEKNRMEHARGEARASVLRHIAQLEEEIDAIEKIIARLVADDELLSRKAEVLRGIKGFGPAITPVLLATMPELGSLNRREIASLAGLAPFAHDSGRWKGKRSIRGGRELARRMLYMAAMTARCWNPEIKVVYTRLRAAGKAPKVALIACARKLLTIANAKLRDAFGSGEQLSVQP
jgi:transposase